MENEMDNTEIEKSDTETADTETAETETAETGKGVKSKYALLVGIGILVFALSFLYGLRILQKRVMSKQLDANLPPFGWVVTEDLDVGEVPGGPTAQRFVVEEDNKYKLTEEGAKLIG